MCLGKIGKMTEVHNDGTAVVEIDGERHHVLLTTMLEDDPRPGEWVTVHAGFVLARITEAEALDAMHIRSTPPLPHSLRPIREDHPT